MQKVAAEIRAIANRYEIHIPGEGNVALVLRSIGDELRSDRLRSELGATDLPQLCGTLLDDKTPASERTEALRVLANLCICDSSNREHILEHGIDAAMLAVLTRHATQQSKLGKSTLLELMAGVGALLNLATDCPRARATMTEAGAVATVSALVGSERIYQVGSWAFGPPQGARPDWAEEIMMRLRIASWGWSLVLTLLDTSDETGQQQLQSEKRPVVWHAEQVFHALTPLRALAANTEKAPAFDEEFDLEEMVELEHAIYLGLSAVLDDGVRSDAFCRLATVPYGEEPSALQSMCEIVRQAIALPLYLRVLVCKDQDAEQAAESVVATGRMKASHAIVAIAGNDANLDTLCPVTPDGQLASDHWFVAELTSAVLAEPELVRLPCSMLALGNLARGEKQCIALAQVHGLVDAVVAHMKNGNMHVAHAAVGLLKNLAIPTTNKPRIAATGLVPTLLTFLARERDMIQPLQYGAVGLLKHLANDVSHPDSVLFLFGLLPAPAKPTEMVQVLLQLYRRTDQLHLKLETTRVFVHIIRSLWSANQTRVQEIAAKQHLTEAHVDEQIKLACTEMHDAAVLDALNALLRYGRTNAVLLSEGLLTLTLVYSANASTASDAATSLIQHVEGSASEQHFSTGAEALVYALGDVPVQIQGNACSLIQVLAAAPPTEAQQTLCAAVRAPLTSLATSTSQIQSAACKALELVEAQQM
ncbi:hypothetical protein MVES1_003103 [Malassezia vespertilionis]|uniref:Uncharacterized protein n=1 Tax=Malassezia vespertilionis TaxID=2020962 RepID=A0A2N1J9P5_9BASI|nr:uncharacterized protein MVES1_003103 [Malassezia vespertilionis]PKI83274.1 hypothetical protein MVES_002945 [Malassezia vespertilionis]WFD07733.1 hypothetical protein MVES1_003103 [Malassezia vespertilionis]